MSPHNTTVPTPDEERPIQTLIPILKEALEYCAAQAVEGGRSGAIAYDGGRDEVTYHLELSDFDRGLFDWLQGTTDVWVITRSGIES